MDLYVEVLSRIETNNMFVYIFFANNKFKLKETMCFFFTISASELNILIGKTRLISDFRRFENKFEENSFVYKSFLRARNFQDFSSKRKIED